MSYARQMHTIELMVWELPDYILSTHDRCPPVVPPFPFSQVCSWWHKHLTELEEWLGYCFTFEQLSDAEFLECLA